ncbi:GIY-YIG nuclease family protein [Croceiramulus getboli]|nr:GIY-YIG nuclease family protein [Flavobacteriaceae bacterium YJPT1-3]
MHLPYTVYILRCSDGTYYTGFTSPIGRRLDEHQRGEVHYTRDKRPFVLVHSSSFISKMTAYDFERYLKSGSGIAFRNKHFI